MFFPSCIYNKTGRFWLILWFWWGFLWGGGCMLTQLRCLIKMWFSLFPWPPCRGPLSGCCACCPRPIDQRNRGLCIEVVYRTADAISTSVNYLHSVPQIWSIVNWASGSCLGEKQKLCGAEGCNLQCCNAKVLCFPSQLWAQRYSGCSGLKTETRFWMTLCSSLWSSPRCLKAEIILNGSILRESRKKPFSWFNWHLKWQVHDDSFTLCLLWAFFSGSDIWTPPAHLIKVCLRHGKHWTAAMKEAFMYT